MGLHFLLPFLSLLFASIPILACGEILETTFYDPKRAIQLSWRPRAFLYKGFLSHEECDHLIKLARGKLVRSMVVDDSWEAMVNEIRTSSGMFLNKNQVEIVSRIESRIASWTFFPEENEEPMQVLHYEKYQKYEPHFDYFTGEFNKDFDRIATLLMYLSEVKKGRETIFLSAVGGLAQLKDETWSTCARTGYAGTIYRKSAWKLPSHSRRRKMVCNQVDSCEISFDILEDESPSSECSDESVQCPYWAAAGECEKNPVYMVGTIDFEGFCRKSCGVWES